MKAFFCNSLRCCGVGRWVGLLTIFHECILHCENEPPRLGKEREEKKGRQNSACSLVSRNICARCCCFCRKAMGTSARLEVQCFFTLGLATPVSHAPTKTHGGLGQGVVGPEGRRSVRQSLPYTLAPTESDDSPLHRPLHAHRLDKPTGGLLVCAKTRPALRALK